MWKTRFEINTNHNNNLTRHRKLFHSYYSESIPTVPRVREDSPSVIIRPTSISNLEILHEEEDEDIPCTNEQQNLLSITVPKQNSYQSFIKHQVVLPTIIESNDHDNEFNTEYFDNQSIKMKQLTNTNNNQIINLDLEKKQERILNTHEIIDRRIHEILQQKTPRQTKSISSSINNNKTEICIPTTTFKDLSKFFENKALAISSEQKKMIKAKRSLLLNKQIPLINNDLKTFEIISSNTEKESTICHHQIKRIKTTHKFQVDQPEIFINNNFVKQSIKSEILNNRSIKKIWWFILILIIITIFVYLYLMKISFRINSLIDDQQQQQSKESINVINNNIISQYGKFVRNYFFLSFNLIMKFIGQLFFRIEKYEYKNNIIYIITSTYEHIYDWFIQ